MTRDTAELWVLESSSGGWDHPVHIHFEEGQVVRKNGVLVERVQALPHRHLPLPQKHPGGRLRFRDFPQTGFRTSRDQAIHTDADPGRYVMHCHNVVHEDHAMMTTWSIRPPPGV